MEDIFSVCLVTNYEKTNRFSNIDYINNIISMIISNRINIDYPEYLHVFNKDNLTFTDNVKSMLFDKIYLLLNNNNIDNHLDRFISMNRFFRILNELNVSYNFLNYKTLYTLQNYYLEIVTSNNNISLLNHWFKGIFNNIVLDSDIIVNKSKYHKSIIILGKYLKNRTNLATSFLDGYLEYTDKYFIDNCSNINLSQMLEKIDKLYNINKLFLDANNQKYYYDNIIIKLLPFYGKYLKDSELNNFSIDASILYKFNSVDLSNTKFIEITFEFLTSWYNKIILKINISNYRTTYKTNEFFDHIKNICPFVNIFKYGLNKSDNIIQVFVNMYNYEANLIDYILNGFNVMIKKYYNNIDLTISDEITDFLNFISIYDNKENLWKRYFKIIYSRIMKVINNRKINNKIINFELSIYNYLLDKNSHELSTKTQKFLSNIQNCLNNNSNLIKCNINYFKSDGNTMDNNFSKPDISKVDYYTIDKSVFDLKTYHKYKYLLIDPSCYSDIINNYYKIGKTYYSELYNTKTFEWDIESSIINFSISKNTFVSTILQFIIITHIKESVNNKYNDVYNIINSLVNKSLESTDLSDAKKYLESFINNLITNNIINKNNNNLTINYNLELKNNSCDISKFKPSINNHTTIRNIQSNNYEKIIMTDTCLSYLRILLLTKMFKTNSTVVFPNDILNDKFKSFLNNYIDYNKFNDSLNNTILELSNIPDSQFMSDISDMEKRDIIEKNDDGYIYVV